MTTLNRTISTLHTVSSLLTKFVQEGDLCFTDKLQLALLYDELRDTNTIIECAEKEAKADIEQLANDATELKNEVENIVHTIADNRPLLTNVDCKAECDAYLKPFESAHNGAMQKATVLWQEYTAMSNRLDMMDMQSEEYKTLDATCNGKKAEYDKAHAEVETLYAKYDAERRRIAKLYYFDITIAELLITKICQIAEATIKDITRISQADDHADANR
jgi:hypothetical protein